jgi:sec-independent protein translocase protein TatB
MADSLILMVLALVVFGPRRLPQIGRQIGKLMYEFRKASNDFKFQMEEELRLAEEAERRKKEEEERARVAALAAVSQASVSAPEQTIEAQADIGALEPSGTPSSEGEAKPDEPYPPETASYPAETAASESDSIYKIPHLQPPRTGEQVSAAAPFAVSAEAQEAAAELNPEADVAANADSVEAKAAASLEADAAMNGKTSPASENIAKGETSEASTSPELPTPPKEPVSQHG